MTHVSSRSTPTTVSRPSAALSRIAALVAALTALTVFLYGLALGYSVVASAVAAVVLGILAWVSLRFEHALVLLPVLVAAFLLGTVLRGGAGLSASSLGLAAVLAVVVGTACLGAAARSRAPVVAGAAYLGAASAALFAVFMAFRGGAPARQAAGTALLVTALLLADGVACDVWPVRAVCVPGARPGLRPLMVVVMTAGALLVAGLGTRPVLRGTRAAWHGTVRIVGRWTGAEEDEASARGGGDAGAGGGAPSVNGEVDLSASNHGRDAGSVRFYVRFHDSEALRIVLRRPLYMRLAAADTFEKQRWFTSFPRKYRLRDEDDGDPDGRVSVGPPPPGTASVTYTVYTRAFTSGMLLGIPALTAVQLPAVDRLRNDTYSSPVTRNIVRCAYTMTSAPISWADIRDRPLTVDEAPAEYRFVTPEPFVAALAAATDAIARRGDPPGPTISALLSYLSTGFEYSDRRMTGEGHPVERFLLAERSGDCRLFATTLVLMLRHVGIPARLAVGYAGGEYDPDQQLFAFYPRHAHAWCEVPFRGYGWVSIDPTPAVVSRPQAAPPSEAPRVDLASYPALAASVSRAVGGGAHPSVLSATGGTSVVLGAVLLAVAGGVLMLRMVLGRGRRVVNLVYESTVEPGFYTLFCRVLARAGGRRERGQTPLEYAASLKARGLIGTEFDDLFAYLYAVAYGNAARRADFERELRRRIRGIKV